VRVVLDTVVFLRALINPHSRYGRAIFELSDRYELVLSPPIIREILAVLYRPSLRERFPQIADVPPLEHVLALFEQAYVVEPTDEVRICRDPDDDKFFACALAAGEDYVVSEDKDVLAVGAVGDVRPIDVATFVALISKIR
jgi:uncharacterized protein